MTTSDVLPPEFNGDDWAGDMGDRWLANIGGFEAMLAPIADALLARADYGPGERVLDLGCGGGLTTLAIARAVAPSGEAVGLDISSRLVDLAALRASEAGIDNALFTCADAATAPPPGAPFDRLFSRFGTMFFTEPVPALANVRAMLAPGARIDLAVWADPADNAWMTGAGKVAAQFVAMPPPVKRAPGPFAFEDRDYAASVLDEAGFSDIAFTDVTTRLAVGGADDVRGATEFALSAMPYGRALEACDPATQAAARKAIEDFFAAHRTDAGVRLGARLWLVSALA